MCAPRPTLNSDTIRRWIYKFRWSTIAGLSLNATHKLTRITRSTNSTAIKIDLRWWQHTRAYRLDNLTDFSWSRCKWECTCNLQTARRMWTNYEIVLRSICLELARLNEWSTFFATCKRISHIYWVSHVRVMCTGRRSSRHIHLNCC